MSESPIAQLLDAVDRLDVRGAMPLMAADARILVADGRRAEGTEAVTELLTACLSTLRSTSHRITAQWNPDDVWIAEAEASYELQDRMRLTAVPRAFVARMEHDRIADLRVYGAHEHQLAEHRTGEEGILVGGRWMPPL